MSWASYATLSLPWCATLMEWCVFGMTEQLEEKVGVSETAYDRATHKVS